MPVDRFGHFADQRALAGLVEVILVLGVGPAVPDDLIAARTECRDDFRAVVIDLAVEQKRYRHLKLIEEPDQPPDADAVAVFAPGPVIGIRMREPGRIGYPEARVV